MLDNFGDGSIRPGHPLLLVPTGETVFYRSSRWSPHAREFLICVAEESGGLLAVPVAELDYLPSEGRP